MTTENINNAYRKALEQYKADRERIKSIENNMKTKAIIENDDILWLCQIAKDGIDNKESNWYDHG